MERRSPKAARSCAFCGSARILLYCEKDSYRILVCGDCGTGFTGLRHGTNAADLYKVGYHRKVSHERALPGYDDYFSLEAALRRTHQNRLKDLLSLKSGGALLDVGCGPGFFLKEAAAHYRVAGIEPGSEAAAHARALGLDVAEGEFRAEAFPPSSFDVVTLFDTIEHLQHPARAIQDARALLRPGGVLMLTTGDFASLAAKISGSRWHLLTVPDHLFFFTRQGMLDLLRRSGFTPLWVRYPHGHFTVDYLIERIVKSTRMGLAYRKCAALRSWLKRPVVPMNLWDIMLIAARKTL